MGVGDTLARLAVRHAHVLLVEAPGHWLTRTAAERYVLGRGWGLALSPADADILAVCGPAGPELAELIDRLWDELPGPRARTDIGSPDAVPSALAAAETDLLDPARQRQDSRERGAGPELAATEHAGHGSMEHGGQGGEEHAGHGGMDHGGMDHGGMDMAPAGIPLAEGGEDRDGLEMDVLRVPLGPVLPYWPAGLIVRCALQGDVITEAESTLIDGRDAGPDGEPPTEREYAARRCDNAAHLLALTGWEDAASRARAVRDALLDGDLTGAPAELDRLRRRVRRSWLLRWSLRRLGPLTAPDLTRRGLPHRLRGDVRDRLLTMLDTAAQSLAGQPATDHAQPVPVAAVADLVRGWDLATARLIVASLDLDPLAADREVSHV